MRTYYLFFIKEEIAKQFIHHEFELFYTLQKLLKKDRNYLEYQVASYRQLCNECPKAIVAYYLERKYHVIAKNHVYRIHNDSYIIRSSYFKIITNKTIPYLFRLLNFTYSYIFVCDFENQDYFYLNFFMNGLKIKV